MRDSIKPFQEVKALKKTALLLAFCVMISVGFTACSKPQNPSQPEETTLSFEEKMSYYNGLADAGEVASEDVTQSGALYKVSGSKIMVNGEVYSAIIDIFNRKYPEIYFKYGDEYYEPVVTLNFDPTYLRDDPANVVGNTINININWFNANPDKASVLIYYIASTILDYNHSAPEWVKQGINYYIGAEFEANGYVVSGGYTGGHYETDADVCATFFKWINAKYDINIAYRIDKLLSSTTWYDEEFWVEETGRSLERLWAEFKAS